MSLPARAGDDARQHVLIAATNEFNDFVESHQPTAVPSSSVQRPQSQGLG